METFGRAFALLGPSCWWRVTGLPPTDPAAAAAAGEGPMLLMWTECENDSSNVAGLLSELPATLPGGESSSPMYIDALGGVIGPSSMSKEVLSELIVLLVLVSGLWFWTSRLIFLMENSLKCCVKNNDFCYIIIKEND